MKKSGWKSLAVCLFVVAAAALLCACGNKIKPADISGTYRATYNMKDQLNEQIAESGITLEDDLNADFILQLNEDETFSYGIDAEGFKENVSEVLEEKGVDIVKAMLTSQGVTEDMYDMIATASGFENFDAFVTEMLQNFETEISKEFESDIADSAHFEGTYEIDENRIVLSGETEAGNGIDEVTVNEDGTISFIAKMDNGKLMNLRFVKE